MADDTSFSAAQCLEILAAHYPDGALTILDRDLRYVCVGGSELAEVGLDRVAMAGRTVSEIFDAETAAQVAPLVTRALSGERVEARMTYAGRTYEVIALPAPDASGDIALCLLVTRNVTRLVRAENAAARLIEEMEERVAERTEKLGRATERLSLALDASSEGLWDWDLIDDTAYCSPRWFTLLGYEPGSFAPTCAGWLDMIANEDRRRVEEQLREHLETGAPYHVECRMRAAGGSEIWILAKGRVVAWDGHGRPARMVGTIADITDRKRAEQALAESERRFRTVFEHTLDGISVFAVDPETGRRRLADCNESYARMAGRGRGELMAAESVAPLMRHISSHPPREEIPARLQERKPFYGMFSWLRPDERENYVEFTAVPIDTADGLLVFGIDRDVTERIQLEHALRESRGDIRAILDASSQAAFLFATDGTIQAVNRTGATMLGTSPEKARHLNLAKIDKAVFDRWQDHVALLVRDKAPLSYREHAFERIFDVTLVPVADDAGRVGRVAAFAEDVTRRLELERRLIQSQKLEAVGSMASGIAHEFNNLLGIVSGFSELARAEASRGSSLFEHLDEIGAATNRAREIVRQMLTFSRTQQTPSTCLALAPTVKEALRLIRASLPPTIDISFTAEDESAAVLSNPTHIHQIMINLCKNAADAMDGEGAVDVRLETVEVPDADPCGTGLEPGPYVRLRVEDTGCGMGPAEIERMFVPFYTTKEPGRGTGMGLPVIQGIVAGAGGMVTAASTPGKGTAVTIHLPKSRLEPGAEPSVDHFSMPLSPDNERVLVVDDEPAFVEVLERMLLSLGYRAVAHTGAREALAEVLGAPESFDAVVTDHAMPRMTGLALAERIRAVAPRMPIILCTGYAEEMLPNIRSGAPVDAVLVKPFLKRELAEKLHLALTASTPEG